MSFINTVTTKKLLDFIKINYIERLTHMAQKYATLLLKIICEIIMLFIIFGKILESSRFEFIKAPFGTTIFWQLAQ
jgi:hypothetical protein